MDLKAAIARRKSKTGTNMQGKPAHMPPGAQSLTGATPQSVKGSDLQGNPTSLPPGAQSMTGSTRPQGQSPLSGLDAGKLGYRLPGSSGGGGQEYHTGGPGSTYLPQTPGGPPVIGYPVPPHGSTLPNTPSQFQFNPEFEALRDSIARNQAQVQSSGQSAIQRLQAALQAGTRDVNQNRDQAMGRSLENLAGQGIVKSGITLDTQNKIGQQYADQIAQMSRDNAWGAEDIQSQVAQQLQQLNQQLAGVNNDQARWQSEMQLERDRMAAENEAAAQRAKLEMQPQPNPTGQYQLPGSTPGNPVPGGAPAPQAPRPNTIPVRHGGTTSDMTLQDGLNLFLQGGWRI